MTRYELLERIGAGRVAEIFRGKAIAAGGFEKPVAIKRILPHLSQDPRFVEALIAEAKILSALRHRNIVQIFDVGLGDDGQHFLVMEFVEGVDLGSLQSGIEARRQRMPIDLVLHIGAEVCEALDHAQAAPGPDGGPMRLVHRDVTPTNVLVSRAGEVKLTDFGLAKRPEDGTQTGGLRGRYGYVSPEQAAGGPVDARSDVFAVGVMMWELAAGRRLFSGLADFDALRAVRESPIARVRELVPDLSADLDAILVEALAKDPRKRLPSAGELGKRLRGLRYTLDGAEGDPAAALARLVITAQSQHRDADARVAARGKAGGRRLKPSTGGFEGGESTVVRIRTADGFAQDPDGTGLINARRVIDRFEEEETRLARLPRAASEDVTSDGARPRSGEVTAEGAPLHLSRDSGEFTVAAPPLEPERLPDRRPRPAPTGARLDQLPPSPPKTPLLPPAGPKGPPPSGRGSAPLHASPPVPPPREPGADRGPEAARRFATPPRPSPVFGGAAAPPGVSQRRDPAPARRDPSTGRGATPTTPRVVSPPAARTSTTPPVAGFGGVAARRWWPIIVGAAVIALLSFVITRAVLDPPALDRGTTVPVRDAGVPVVRDAGVPVVRDAGPELDGGTAAAPAAAGPAPVGPAAAAAAGPAIPATPDQAAPAGPVRARVTKKRR